MKSDRESKEGGFSLLEMLVAFIILSIGVIGLAMFQLTAITAKAPASASNVRTATALAQGVLDRLGETPWAGLGSSSPGGFREGQDGTSPDFSRIKDAAGDAATVQGTSYYSVWRVKPDAEIPSLKTITVWCCWRQGNGPWRQVVLVTQRADAGR